MKYLYLLSVSDAETGEDVEQLDSYDLKELLDQMKRKIPLAIDNYEARQKEFANEGT